MRRRASSNRWRNCRRKFRDAGVKPGDRVVTYCFIGQQASALYLVSRYLGYDTRLYDGSWDEWTKHPGTAGRDGREPEE